MSSVMKSYFWPLVVLSQLFAVAMLVVMTIWLQHHVGGIVWGASGGYHPLFLTVALVFLFGEALLAFRVFSRCGIPYLIQKAIHATTHTVIIVLTGVGVRAATMAKDGQYEAGTVHNYSIHSWLGIFTVILLCLQYVIGCVYYGAAERFLRQDHPLRAHYPQIHVFFGMFTFTIAIVSCLTGLNELSIYQIADYSTGVFSGALGNVYGLSMVLFGSVLAFVTTRSEYKTDTTTHDVDSPRERYQATTYQDGVPTENTDVRDDVMDDGDGLKMQQQNSP